MTGERAAERLHAVDKFPLGLAGWLPPGVRLPEGSPTGHGGFPSRVTHLRQWWSGDAGSANEPLVPALHLAIGDQADSVLIYEARTQMVLSRETPGIYEPEPLQSATLSVRRLEQSVNFGIGAFTARQLLVASNGSRVVVIPVGINKILTAVPGGAVTIITLPAGATEGLSGALTSDGNTLWLGVGGVNTLDKIDLTTGTDVLQIPNTFKKSDGSPAPPNIVALQPK